jgi:septal ring factor EnvC (AmiA/AmiB activator)
VKRGLLIGPLLSLFAVAALAQEDPAFVAKRAAGQLEAAQNALFLAERSTDRVAALTQTIRAYEEGLKALREGIRRAAIRETALAAKFEAERDQLARLLGVLQAIEGAPAPLLLLHPSGPIGTARSGMIASDVVPALQAEAATLRIELEEMALMRAIQESAEAQLADGLRGVQEARTALSAAMSNRVDLPRRLLDDPDAMSALLSSADTLRAFAAGIQEMKITGADAPLHMAGTVLRRFQERDAAGIARPGLVIAAEPRALVTTPWPATIRYRGPLLDYGNVMVLEPGDGYLLVLAGLNEVYGETGEVLPQGAPVGLMGGTAPDARLIFTASSEGAGIEKTETLYMELRQGDAPVDPGIWFAFDG